MELALKSYTIKILPVGQFRTTAARQGAQAAPPEGQTLPETVLFARRASRCTADVSRAFDTHPKVHGLAAMLARDWHGVCASPLPSLSSAVMGACLSPAVYSSQPSATSAAPPRPASEIDSRSFTAGQIASEKY